MAEGRAVTSESRLVLASGSRRLGCRWWRLLCRRAISEYCAVLAECRGRIRRRRTWIPESDCILLHATARSYSAYHLQLSGVRGLRRAAAENSVVGPCRLLT